MDESSASVDVVTLAGELRQHGMLAEVGGQDLVFALPGLCPVAASVAEYAGIVQAMSRRRDGIALARRLEQAFAEGTNSEQQAAGLELQGLLRLSCGCRCQACASANAPQRPTVKSAES